MLQISPALQGDGLHPSPTGMDIMAKCISPMLDELMKLKPSAYEQDALPRRLARK